MEFKRCYFSTTYHKVLPLLKQHKEEIDLFGLELDIDVETYLNWEAADVSRSYVAMEGDEIIGYALFVLFTHNHHKTSQHATQDVLFVKKEKRGTGLDFIKFCEDQLRAEGVNVIHQCVPASNDWGRVLEFKGYRKLETIYIKDL